MNKTTFIADSAHVRTSGRTYFKDGIRYLGYTASFIEFEFTGTYASAEIWSDMTPDMDIFRAHAAVFINGSTTPAKRIKIESEKAEYELFSSDTPQTVTIRLMKLSEAAFAKLGITKLTVCGENVRPTKPSSDRRIEFIGDSITCGYGIDGVWNKDTFSTDTENPLKGFALKTAAKCNAEYQFVSWSGIGVYSSWVDENAEKPLADWLMPMIYPYTDRGLENILGITDHEEWDFSSYVPQVIVFNIGTNDHSFTKDIPERQEEFYKTYLGFLRLVREKNPDAYIICTYGIMGTILCDTENRAVEALRSEGDKKIEYIPLPEQLESDGIGADWHPSEISHSKMADILSKRINEVFTELGL
ncbi:MAG: GDSL-type esterase/lipase family protein [Huintestinicola sp.]